MKYQRQIQDKWTYLRRGIGSRAFLKKFSDDIHEKYAKNLYKILNLIFEFDRDYFYVLIRFRFLRIDNNKINLIVSTNNLNSIKKKLEVMKEVIKNSSGIQEADKNNLV